MTTGKSRPDAALDRWAHAATWGREPRLNEFEALMWRTERHPEVSSQLLALFLLDQPPDWDRLVAGFDWATSLFPRLRERLVDPYLPISTPAWSEDPDFALDRHVHRDHLPAGSDEGGLLAFAQEWALIPLDRTRPLWDLVTVDGMTEGRAAIIIKMHHSVTDGMGVIQLLGMLLSHTREPNPHKPTRESVEGRTVTALGLTVGGAVQTAADLQGLGVRAAQLGGKALANPREARRLMRYASSAARVLLATKAPHSPLLTPRTHTDWRFGTLECDFAALRAAGHAAGGSVNDALVAAVLGGMRRYHQLHDVHLDELAMAITVSVRQPGELDGGNKFVPATYSGPMGVADPVERIATVRAIVQQLREEPGLGAINLASGPINRLPSMVGVAAVKAGSNADVSVSNVPGLAWQPYICGAEVLRYYPFSPLPGVAVMATMLSFNGLALVGLTIDGSAIDDLGPFMDCMADGMDEVLALADG